MVVVFSVAKSLICFVEFNSHDSLQACLIEGIGHCVTCRYSLNNQVIVAADCIHCIM